MTRAIDRHLLRAYASLPCEQCGETMPRGVNAHIRECKQQDVEEIAHRIVSRVECYVDAEAELVAAAYLKAIGK